MANEGALRGCEKGDAGVKGRREKGPRPLRWARKMTLRRRRRGGRVSRNGTSCMRARVRLEVTSEFKPKRDAGCEWRQVDFSDIQPRKLHPARKRG